MVLKRNACFTTGVIHGQDINSMYCLIIFQPIGAPMGMAMAPPYTGYPTSGSSVISVGSAAPPMMMVPAYGLPAYSHVPAYGSALQVTTAPNPARAAVARPKPLTEEARICFFSSFVPFIHKSKQANNDTMTHMCVQYLFVFISRFKSSFLF